MMRSLTNLVSMRRSLPGVFRSPWLPALFIGLLSVAAVPAQTLDGAHDEFGPVMKAYLGYLRNEQEVVDDRVSKREVNRAYYRRNSSRIRALRQMAIRIVRDSGNDYIPELEAVTRDEMRNLFERPPALASLQLNQVLNHTFRYLGVERAGEVFYMFQRLDPYEQADLMEKAKAGQGSPSEMPPPHPRTAGSRPRRVVSPD